MRSARPRVVSLDDYFAEHAEMITPEKPSRVDWTMFFSGVCILAGVALVAWIFWMEASK
jgi:hypothetical protein